MPLEVAQVIELRAKVDKIAHRRGFSCVHHGKPATPATLLPTLPPALLSTLLPIRYIILLAQGKCFWLRNQLRPKLSGPSLEVKMASATYLLFFFSRRWLVPIACKSSWRTGRRCWGCGGYQMVFLAPLLQIDIGKLLGGEKPRHLATKRFFRSPSWCLVNLARGTKPSVNA
jgi:hypothetical protein